MIKKHVTNVLLWALVTIMLLGLFGCGSSVLAQPSPIGKLDIPEWHNMPVVMPDGSLIRVCATQPREYIAVNGQHVIQRDAYAVTGSEVCPKTPIQ